MTYPSSPGYVKSSPTSHAAAKSMEPSAGTVRHWVFKAIKKAGRKGLTCEQAEDRLGLSHQTVSARIRELFLEGNIEVIGARENLSGRMARVYVAKAA